MRRFLLPLVLVGSSIGFIGCHSTTATTPPAALAPGAVNQFDQDSYKSLMVVQASLNSLKSSIQANTQLASLQAPLNQAIADYNIADLAWQTYHSAATTANQAAVTAALTKVQTDVTGLQQGVQ